MSTQIKISELPQISDLTNDIIWPASTNVSGEFTSGVISIEQIRNNILGESFEQNNLSDIGISSFSGRIGTLETKVYDLESIDYATKEDIPEVPSLDGYAKTEDIPSLLYYAKYSELPFKTFPNDPEELTSIFSKTSNSGLVGVDGLVNNNVQAQNSIVFGDNLIAPNHNCAVFGSYNNAQASWDAMLWIGQGTSDQNRQNMMIVQQNQIHYRGEIKEASNWIGDFGEYFEWKDGNVNNEDRVGYMVQNDGTQIEFATSFENCIGVISDTCILTGGACSFEWHGMYKRDDFGRIIYEEINGEKIPVKNPNYDESLQYISRDKRKEWGKVGLMGQIFTRQDGTLKVNGYAGCNNGIATLAESGYKVLKIINENVAVLLVK